MGAVIETVDAVTPRLPLASNFTDGVAVAASSGRMRC